MRSLRRVLAAAIVTGAEVSTMLGHELGDLLEIVAVEVMPTKPSRKKPASTEQKEPAWWDRVTWR